MIPTTLPERRAGLEDKRSRFVPRVGFDRITLSSNPTAILFLTAGMLY